MRAGIDWRVAIPMVLFGVAVVACNPGASATGTPAATSTASASPPASVATLSPAVSATPAQSPSPSSAATATATAVGGPGGSGSPPALDPCTLLTTDQASAVNGVSYPAGKASVMGTGSVECVWQSSTPPASVVVQVAVLPSVTDAQVAYAEAQAEIAGAVLTKVTDFGDEAVIARAPSGLGMSTGGIYVRDGDTFFDVVYLNGTVPTDDQLKFAATLVLGALP